ncbi:MAG: DUF3618 domain-containing protein [Paracoccaceae bacterium]
MTDHRTPEEIERDIERERAGLTDTLDTLQNRLSVDGLIDQVTGHFREHGGDIATNVARTAKENPIGLALTGIGIAMMLAPSRSRPETVTRVDYYDGPYAPHPARSSGYAASGDYRSAAPGPDWTRPEPTSVDYYGESEGDDGSSLGERLADRYDEAKSSVADAMGGAKDRWSEGTEHARSGYDSTRASLAGGYASASGRAGEIRDNASARMTAMRERLSKGTEDLSEQARDRVIAARQRAMAARDDASRMMRERGRDAQRMYHDQPLVAGAIAMAVGAAIGAMAPRTRVEDQYLGAYSDRLIDEAEHIYREERSRAEAVARAALDEARDVAHEKGEKLKGVAKSAKEDAKSGSKTAAGEAKAEVQDAAARVADAAKAEADKQDLGKSIN